jgi:hypothetical protein
MTASRDDRIEVTASVFARLRQPPGHCISLQRLLYERLRVRSDDCTAMDHRPGACARNLSRRPLGGVFERFVRAFDVQRPAARDQAGRRTGRRGRLTGT